jgi:hypothetical protein
MGENVKLCSKFTGKNFSIGEITKQTFFGQKLVKLAHVE